MRALLLWLVAVACANAAFNTAGLSPREAAARDRRARQLAEKAHSQVAPSTSREHEEHEEHESKPEGEGAVVDGRKLEYDKRDLETEVAELASKRSDGSRQLDDDEHEVVARYLGEDRELMVWLSTTPVRP